MKDILIKEPIEAWSQNNIATSTVPFSRKQP